MINKSKDAIWMHETQNQIPAQVNASYQCMCTQCNFGLQVQDNLGGSSVFVEGSCYKQEILHLLFLKTYTTVAIHKRTPVSGNIAS